jgi:hypothetical protein
MNRIALTINGRTVYWDTSADHVAQIAQILVHRFGPAKEGDES